MKRIVETSVKWCRDTLAVTNFPMFFFSRTLVIMAATLVSIPILQYLALTLGLNEVQLGQAKFAYTFCNGVAMFIFMRSVARMSPAGIIKFNYISQGYLLIFPLVSVFLCIFAEQLNTTVIFWVFTIGWALSGIAFAGYLLASTQVMLYLFEPKAYAFVYGLSGVFIFIFGAAISAGAMGILSDDTGIRGIMIIMILSLVLGAGSVLTASRFKVATQPQTESVNTSESRPVKDKTVIIVIMHVIRGVITGIFYFMLPIGIRYYNLFAEDAAFLTLLFAVAGVAACLIILKWLNLWGVSKLLIISLIVDILATVVLIIFHDRYVFLIIYFISNISIMVFSESFPIGLLKTIAPQRLAAVTSLRFLAFMVSDALTSLTAGLFIDLFIPLLIIMCFAKLIKIFLVHYTFKGTTQ